MADPLSRLILHAKQPLPPGSSCMRQDLGCLPAHNTAKLVFSDFFRHTGVFSHGDGALILRAVEDADLIRKARRGDVEAYNLLISRWERRVYNYLLRIVANREDALDLSQDVFLKAYQNLRKLDDPARFAPWLYRIAHNEAYSLFRKRRPEGETEELQPETLEGAATVGGNAVFPVELTLAVSSALRKLTADQRETVILKIYQGFKFEEIAEIVAAPVSTVKSRLYTALDLLKAELATAAECGGLEDRIGHKTDALRDLFIGQREQGGFGAAQPVELLAATGASLDMNFRQPALVFGEILEVVVP